MSIYGKKIKEVKTKYGYIWFQKIPIHAGMEYSNGKILNMKIKEIGYYIHAIYVDKFGMTMNEISGNKCFYNR